ncbi:hypothetical protein evm_000263 [Chilo suppressalis]|nr:hypothetical protein evm_000263 [Chilo suppressalis]
MFQCRILVLLACFVNYHYVQAIWSCSQNDDCSALTGSVCSNGECVCPAGTQNVLGGSRCDQAAPYHTSSCFDDFQCSRLFTNYECRRPANSSTTEAGQCFCREGNHYFRGRCWPSTQWGEACSTDEQCMYVLRDPFSMSCTEGTCQCAPGYYLRQRGECRKSALAVGDMCVIDEDCQFAGASCQMSTLTCITASSNSFETKTHTAGINTTSITNTIEVNRKEADKEEPVSSTKTRELTRQHGVVCSDDSGCQAPFQCSSLRICTCPLGYYPNAAGTICLAEMGSPVTSADQCVGLFTEVRNGICTCHVNFYYDEAMRGCVKPAVRLSDFCFSDAGCHTFGVAGRCGPETTWGLRQCYCASETMWNERRQLCALFSGVGERCDVDDDCLAGELEIQCVRNDEGYGVCSCPDGYVASDGLCLMFGQGLGDVCQVDAECSDVENGVCVDGLCTCDDGYQQLEDYCAPVIGGRCEEDANCVIEDTICDNSTSTCQCSSEFVASADSCWPVVAGFEAPCNVTEQCAAAMGPAGACHSGICVCQTGYHYRDDGCQPKTGLFESCRTSSVCFLESGSHKLECRNSLCQCSFHYPYLHDQGVCSPTRTNSAGDIIGNYKILMATLLYIYYS